MTLEKIISNAYSFDTMNSVFNNRYSIYMTSRQYYSARTGKNPHALKYDLSFTLRLFRDVYSKFDSEYYFQEAFGYYCVDAGNVAGTLGSDIDGQIFRRLRKPNLWTILQKYEMYTEDDLFDVIEFLYDHISKPIDGYHHTWNNCGWHYKEFDANTGRQEFRDEINEILCDYNYGYELSVTGEILVLPESGLENLIQASIPTNDPQNIQTRVNSAILKFRRQKSSIDDRRDAVRDLADVLEFIRSDLKVVLTKSDDSDLFHIANKFGIRHHNEDQKTNYDQAIWLSWIFYFYLATIHAALRFIEKQQSS